MNIGIDASALAIPYSCGTKNYAVNLLTALAKVDSQNRYFLFTPKKVEGSFGQFEQVIVPKGLPRFKRQILSIPGEINQKIDVFHYLDPFGVALHSHPRSILTVHDLGLSLTHKWLSAAWYKRAYTEIMLLTATSRASRFITISKTIECELSKYLYWHGWESKPINTVYHGANHVPQKSNKSRKEHFFLLFGDFAWRKNVDSVLHAYSNLPLSIKAKYRLKLIVSSQDFSNLFVKRVSELELSSYVDILVEITDDQLYCLYQTATALVYPSLYEGFGLPIIEAMRNECPVITTNWGATKEVSGDAAVFVNSLDHNHISKAMFLLAISKKYQSKYSKKGLQRANEFTWEKAAQKTLRIYQEAYSSG